MRYVQIIAAGLLLAGVGVSTEAAAQPGPRHGQHDRGPDRGPGRDRDWRGDRHDRHDRWDRRDDRRWDRHDNRRDRRWGRHDRGNHYGWRNNHRRDCRIVWRHGQRQRVCR